MTDGERLARIHPARELDVDERAAVEQLLQRPFRGRDALRAQLDVARVCAKGTGDTRTAVFENAEGVLPSAANERIPVEGRILDDDQTPIAVLLHVVDGLVLELEIYRVDGEPIQRARLDSLATVTVNEIG